MDRTYLEINVCDICIVDAAEAGNVLIGETPSRPQPELRPWMPDSAASSTLRHLDPKPGIAPDEGVECDAQPRGYGGYDG